MYIHIIQNRNLQTHSKTKTCPRVEDHTHIHTPELKHTHSQKYCAICQMIKLDKWLTLLTTFIDT